MVSRGQRFPDRLRQIRVPGIDLRFPVDQAAFVREKLKQTPVDSETAENLRIEQGIARWGNESSAEVIPSEAGLDKRAISFTKGFYSVRK
jgi:tRNA-modifying protein YgfZ